MSLQYAENKSQKVVWIHKILPLSLAEVQKYLDDGWIVSSLSPLNFHYSGERDERYGAYCVLTKPKDTAGTTGAEKSAP